MSIKNILFILLCVSVTGCNFFSKNERNTERDYDIVTEEDLKNYTEEDDNASELKDVRLPVKIVRPDIVDGKGSIDIQKDENQTIDVEIGAFGHKTIHAILTSHDAQANIRFAQIIMPDGSSDGPFGRELSYDLQTDGNYTLRITENMMAGEPWSGTFTLDFELD